MKNRNIVELLERVKKQIPMLWFHGVGLKIRLVKIQYVATRLNTKYNNIHFESAANVLSEYLDPVDCEWKRNILKTFLGSERVAQGNIYGLDKHDPGLKWESWDPKKEGSA